MCSDTPFSGLRARPAAADRDRTEAVWRAWRDSGAKARKVWATTPPRTTTGRRRVDHRPRRRHRAVPAPRAPPGAERRGRDRPRREVRRERRRVVRRGLPAGQPNPVSHAAARRPSGRAGRAHRDDHGAGVDRAATGLGHPFDRVLGQGQELRHRLAGDRGLMSNRSMRQCEACMRSGRLPGPAGTASTMSRPSGRAASRAARPMPARPPGRARFRGTRPRWPPRWRGAEVRDLRMRREAAGVGHRQGGAAQRPFEGAGEVTVGAEPQPPALGVPDPQPLDDRGRRRPLGHPTGHGQLTGRSAQSRPQE